MLPHVLYHAVYILEETHMAELVDLVMSDGLDAELLSDILEVIEGSSTGSYA